MPRPEKAKKIILRSSHFKDMRITFSTESGGLQDEQVMLGLDVKGLDAMPVVTEDSHRHISLTINPNTGDLTVSESRGDGDGSKLRKGASLPFGTYNVLHNEVGGENVWSMSIKSSIPIHVQSGPGQCGTLLAVAESKEMKNEATKVAARMPKSLTLGKQELWFARQVVNHMDVVVPDCHGSKMVSIDEVVKFFDASRSEEPQQAISNTVEGTSVVSEFSWHDGDAVQGQVGAKIEEGHRNGKSASFEEIPENWFDAIDDLTLEDAGESARGDALPVALTDEGTKRGGED